MGSIRRQATRIWNFLKELWTNNFYMGPALWSYTVFFLIGLALFKGLHYLPELCSFKEIAIEDIDLSDLYYQSQPPSAKDSIIIVNVGTLKEDSLSGKRRELTDLINTIKTQKPKRIGVDMYFDEPKEDPIANAILGEALNNDTIVLATDGKAEPGSFEEEFLRNGRHIGYIIVPTEEHRTIRAYFNHDSTATYNSFANRCAGALLNPHEELSYPLKYSVKGKGYYNIEKDTITMEEFSFAFPAVEAKSVLHGNMEKTKLENLFKNKIVLLGHLGSGNMDNPYDIEDKHKTPTELEFISKRPIMPGVVIHANAIAQKIAKVSVFNISGLLELVLIYVLVFGYLKVLELFHHIKNIFVKLFFHLAFTIVSLLFICWVAIQLMRIDFHFNPINLIAALILLGELSGSMNEYKEKILSKKVNP